MPSFISVILVSLHRNKNPKTGLNFLFCNKRIMYFLSTLIIYRKHMNIRAYLISEKASWKTCRTH